MLDCKGDNFNVTKSGSLISINLEINGIVSYIQLNLCKTATLKMVFKINYRLMQVDSIAFCNTFDLD